MTFDKYVLLSFLKIFGLQSSVKRLSAATSETLLYREGIELLGYSNKDNIEAIDELKSHYWDNKERVKKITKLREVSTILRTELDDASEKNNEFQSASFYGSKELQENLKTLLSTREKITQQKLDIAKEGKHVRKIYDGLIAQQKNNAAHLTPEEAQKLQEKIDICIEDLRHLKTNRDRINAEYDSLIQRITHQENLIASSRNSHRNNDNSSQRDLSTLNQALSNSLVDQKRLEQELHQSYITIGKHLFDHHRDHNVRSCIKNERRVVKQLTALQKSIDFNQRLGR